ncbi:Inx2 (predicted) [Pycnogonum litorale]
MKYSFRRRLLYGTYGQDFTSWTMFEALDSLRHIVKTSRLSIDNFVFRLHYKATVLILLTCCLLVGSRQYFGDPIECAQSDDIPHKLIDSYCWIHSTFTLPRALNKIIGTEVAHPGVDKTNSDDEKVYHAYYQWVTIALFLQAVLFYIPHYLWKSWEGQKMRALVLGLDNPVLDDEEKEKRKELLTRYLYSNMRNQNLYFVKFFVCEIVNAVNVLSQIWLVDAFLEGEFTTYGIKVIEFAKMNQEDRTDPMIRIFPRVTKCTFHKFGPSGDIQRHDALCVLTINVINEKVYVFLWFWFVILAILSISSVVYRLLLIISPDLRRFVLRTCYGLVSRRRRIDVVSDEGGVGDWFVLNLLGKNLDSFNFKSLIDHLSRRCEFSRTNGSTIDSVTDI